MSIVLGYHGCDVETARNLLGGSAFAASDKPYDWLGYGSYFWEWDIVRAYEWAQDRRAKQPCVVGAVIELGNCLDLTTRRGAQAVRAAYSSYLELQTETGNQVPINHTPQSATPGSLALRFLDRAVIDHLHQSYAAASRESHGRIQLFDTVRALFSEGVPLYPGAGFYEKTHVQIAVTKPQQIRGVFRVPLEELMDLKIPNIYLSL